ncbi:uncharacterized protein LOC123554625 isoform X2 [Mercenaria mercenaria]|nr:uncharacterized protein LOC123554625 isoform X2 [Mercenaria mercenaria]
MHLFWLTLVLVCIGASASTTTSPSIPTGSAFNKIMDGSFKNVDRDTDGIIERYEFDNLVIIADKDNNGCMTLEEYKNFSAGGPEIASRIYKHFDTSNTNCLRVDDVSSQFDIMDADNNGMVTMAEFQKYYVNLLQSLFHVTILPVG